MLIRVRMISPPNIAFCLLLLVSVCNGQQINVPEAFLDPGAACQGFGTAGYTPTTCTSVVPLGASIYVNSTYNQSVGDAISATYSAKIAVVQTIDPTCAGALQSYLCATLFSPCVYYNDSGNASISYALPQYTCEEMCTQTNTICASIYQQFGVPPEPCAPNVTYDFSASGGPSSYSPGCTLGYLSTNGSNCPAACPRPDYQDVNQCCQLVCPVGMAVYGTSSYNALIYTVCTFMLISSILSALTSILYTVNPVLRRFPGWLIICCGWGMTISTFMVSLTMLIGPTRMNCPTPVPEMAAACYAQGLIDFFGIFTTLSFWLAMNAVTFAVVILPNPRLTMSFLTEYQWFFLLLFLIPIFATFANGYVSKQESGYAFGPNGMIPWCAVYSNSVHRDIFSVWATVMLGIGTILWLISMGKIFHVWWVNRKSRSSSDLRMHGAIMAFELAAILTIGIFLIIFFCVFDFFEYDLKSELLAYISGASNTPPSAPYAAIFVMTLCPAMVGILFAIIFGLRKAHWDFIRGKAAQFGVGVGSTSTTGASGASGSAASGASQSNVTADKSSFGVYSIGTDGDGDQPSNF